MGLFGPKSYYRERTFTMPCNPQEAVSVIAAADGVESSRPFGVLIDNYLAAQQRGEVVGQPPLAETVYLETLSDSGLIIAAGNRTRTMWRLRLALTGANPVSGSFGAIDVNQDRWFKNVWEFNSALGDAVRSVGGKRGRWPAEF